MVDIKRAVAMAAASVIALRRGSTRISCIGVGVLLLLSCGPLVAQEAQLRLGASHGLLQRGILLGRDGLSLQAGASYHSAARWFATLHAATLRSTSDDARSVQIVGTIGGFRELTPDWTAQLDGAHYGYPLDAPLRRFESNEVRATLAYRDLVFMSVSGLRRLHAIDPAQRFSASYELTARHPLDTRFALAAGLGRWESRQPSSFGYAYGHIGVTARAGAANLQLFYVVTDGSAKARFGASASNRMTAALNWSL